MAEPAEPTARERMVLAAGKLFRERGYAASSLREIVAASGAPWGSLAHYFPGGKQQLALEAIALGARQVADGIDRSFAGASSPADGAQRFFDGGMALMVQSDFTFGCPLATVALERAGTGDPLVRACAEAFDDWEARFAAGFVAGGVAPGPAATIATATLMQYEGALLLARVHRSAEPLRLAGEAVQAMLAAAR